MVNQPTERINQSTDESLAQAIDCKTQMKKRKKEKNRVKTSQRNKKLRKQIEKPQYTENKNEKNKTKNQITKTKPPTNKKNKVDERCRNRLFSFFDPGPT